VVHDGSEPLARTLDALRAQTRPADGVIAVAIRASEATIEELGRVPGMKVVTSTEDLSFAQAVAAGVRVTDQPEDAEQMLWLLSEDTAPEPTALAALLGALEVSPSVGVAGPKILDWDDASFLRRYGETITTLGAAVPVVEDELDQAQHDTMNDVMAVGPAGMLVRHQLWATWSRSCRRHGSPPPARGSPGPRGPTDSAPVAVATARPARRSSTVVSSTHPGSWSRCTGSASCPSPSCGSSAIS
jgi:hypothetical protein